MTNKCKIVSIPLIRIFMLLVAIHSFMVGLSLILLPGELIALFGFNKIEKNFFQCQGGVFHIVMCIAYIGAAFHPVKNFQFIQMSILAKLIATIFLISYFLFVNQISTVLLSGLADFAMGILLIWIAKFLRSAYPDEIVKLYIPNYHRYGKS